MLRRFCAISMVAFLVAGCVDDGPNHDSDIVSPEGNSHNEGNDTEAPSLPKVAPTGHSIFNACRGQTFALTWPPGQNPGRIPTGWESSTGTSSSYIWVLECERARIGPFERAIDWVLEGRTGVSAPPNCSEVAHPAVSVLNWVATSDAEVSRWLTNATGLDVATVDVSISTSGDPEQHHATVDLDGRTILDATAIDHGMRSSQPVGSITTFAAHRDGGLAQFNLTLGMTGTSGPGLPFTGSASEPLLAATWGPMLVGDGLALGEGDAAWEVRRHASLDCT